MTVVAFPEFWIRYKLCFPQFVNVMIKKHAPTCENATKRRKHPFVVPFPSRPAPGEPYLSWLPFHSRLPACSFLFSIAAFRRAPFSWPVGGQYYLNTPFFPWGKTTPCSPWKISVSVHRVVLRLFSSPSEEILYSRSSLLALTDDCCSISGVLDPLPIVFCNL